MFDSHCHLHDERMAEGWEEAARRAVAAGVRGLLLAGVDEPGWRREDELAPRLQAIGLEVARSYGLHPQVAAQLDAEGARRQVAALAALLGGAATPDAVGEIGLDGLPVHQASLDDGRQEAAFRAQLSLARERDLPVVLHILRAHGPALRVLQADGVPRRGGVVHSYSGAADLVPAYLALGLSISFAGPVTYDNARRVQAAARAVPRERLLVETDAPDQTPRPRRPGRNEPAYLPDVIAGLAACRGEDLADVARCTADNARRLYFASSR